MDTCVLVVRAGPTALMLANRCRSRTLRLRAFGPCSWSRMNHPRAKRRNERIRQCADSVINGVTMPGAPTNITINLPNKALV